MILTEVICEGRYHNTDGPAYENETDDLYEIGYFFHGLRHNTDGPAYIKHIKKDGKIITKIIEYWYLGMRHNTDGPAVITEDYDLDGNSIGELKMWFHFDNLDNKEVPAIYESHGDYSRIAYYDNGLKHNIDGPAEIMRSKYISLTAWYFKGKLHNMNGLAKNYKYLYGNKVIEERVRGVYGNVDERIQLEK